MDKLVAIAVVVLIVVSIWVVMPSEPPAVKTQEPTTVAEASYQSSATTASNQAAQSPADDTTQRRTKAQQNRRPKTSAIPNAKAPKTARQQTESTIARSVNPQLIAKAAKSFKEREDEEPPSDEGHDNPFGDVPWDGEVDYHDLEDALMKHYAKRTAEGGLPDRVVASQILSESVLEMLKVPNNMPVRLIGDFDPGDPRSVSDTLKRARKGEHETGFTFDDGSVGGRRVYIKVIGD